MRNLPHAAAAAPAAMPCDVVIEGDCVSKMAETQKLIGISLEGSVG